MFITKITFAMEHHISSWVLLIVLLNFKEIYSTSVDDVVLPTDSCDCAASRFEDYNLNWKIPHEQRVVGCYFPNWGWAKSGRGSFTPDNINASLCTHIYYAFAFLNSSLKIDMSDPTTDEGKGFYKKVTALKSQGPKVLLSVGGWTNSNGTRWRQMLNDESSRDAFVESVMIFMEKYDFDGVDMDYEYPGCPQGNKTNMMPSDIVNFNQLMRELKTAFGDKYLLTVATSAGKWTIPVCYNMSELCHIVDLVNVMTYDYNSYRNNMTGAQAPLCNNNKTWGVYHTVKYYLSVANCPAKKLVLGIPFYGKSYTMASTHPAKFGVPTIGPGVAGNYTRSAGTLAYYEICLLAAEWYNEGYSRTNGSYAFGGDQFVSYDDTYDVIRKCGLIRKLGLGGAMVWAINYDDFNDLCGGGAYPLLHTLNSQLRPRSDIDIEHKPTPTCKPCSCNCD